MTHNRWRPAELYSKSTCSSPLSTVTDACNMNMHREETTTRAYQISIVHEYMHIILGNPQTAIRPYLTHASESLQVSLEDRFRNVSSRELTTAKETTSETLMSSSRGWNTIELHVDVTLSVSSGYGWNGIPLTRDILSTLIFLIGPYLLSTSPLMSSAMSRSQFLSVSLSVSDIRSSR
jgi:hypothetical protein